MAFRNVLLSVLTKHVHQPKVSSTFSNVVHHRPLSTINLNATQRNRSSHYNNNSRCYAFENKLPLNLALTDKIVSLVGSQQKRNFHALQDRTQPGSPDKLSSLFHEILTKPITLEPKRTVIKYSMIKGKRKTDKDIIKRFRRLQWGGWIHTRPGRHKKLWQASDFFRMYKRQHVFVGATKSYMFDKMITKFWYKKKYYVDDPYESYELRPNYPEHYLRRKVK